LTVGALVLGGGSQAAAGGAVADGAVAQVAEVATAASASEQAPASAAEQPAATVAEASTDTSPANAPYVVSDSPVAATTATPATTPAATPAAEEVPITDLNESEVLALDDETVVANAAEIADSAQVGELVIQAQEELGRAFTDEELAILASGLKAQYAYEQALAEGRAADQQFTAEEQEAIDEAALLQTGVDTESGGSFELFLSNSKSGFNPGGKWAEGIGVYPTTKGKILATADWYKNFIPTGHSALVINQDSAYTALSEGVTIEPNNWYEPSRYQTAFGVDVNKTNEAQEAKATDWCKQHLGKPYNYLYILPERTDAFYCSSLVWQAYKATTGVNLDTSAFNILGFKAVHPMELVDSSQTSLVYLQGNARTGYQTVNGVKYYIGSNGRPR
jgi:hypothetical protein